MFRVCSFVHGERASALPNSGGRGCAPNNTFGTHSKLDQNSRTAESQKEAFSGEGPQTCHQVWPSRGCINAVVVRPPHPPQNVMRWAGRPYHSQLDVTSWWQECVFFGVTSRLYSLAKRKSKHCLYIAWAWSVNCLDSLCASRAQVVPRQCTDSIQKV